MPPEQHKNAILAAMLRCRRERDTPSSGESIAAHDAAVAALALDYEVSLRNAEYLEAKLQKLVAEVQANDKARVCEALQEAIDLVSMHGGSVEIEAAIRALMPRGTT